MQTNFLKVVSSAIVDKYIGESARLIREMFGYAKEHEPCIIFMDEIDAIGGRRFSEGTSADREIQRTLMEVNDQLLLRECTTLTLCKVAQPNGWIRLSRPCQTDHGDESTRYVGSCTSATWTTRPKDRNPATKRTGTVSRTNS
jgi:SpoVK/Ycf46/Vps4 family AAA+-type ATPase